MGLAEQGPRVLRIGALQRDLTREHPRPAHHIPGCLAGRARQDRVQLGKFLEGRVMFQVPELGLHLRFNGGDVHLVDPFTGMWERPPRDNQGRERSQDLRDRQHAAWWAPQQGGEVGLSLFL